MIATALTEMFGLRHPIEPVAAPRTRFRYGTGLGRRRRRLDQKCGQRGSGVARISAGPKTRLRNDVQFAR